MSLFLELLIFVHSVFVMCISRGDDSMGVEGDGSKKGLLLLVS